MRWSAFGAALFSLASVVTALDAVSVYGNKFFNKDGSQFFIKGVAYQLTPDDPLVDTAQCKRDASMMTELGANTIRVYHVNATGDHDGCMEAFADAGIYVLVDLDTFTTYILADDLYWNQTQYDRYAQVMDTFQGYDNILGFFIGNENIAKEGDSPAAPYLKAAARDMKAYRDKKGYRDFPIGYSAADIEQLRPMLQDYLTCGGNASDNVDFFSLNSYSWCDPSSYTESSYNLLEEYAHNFPVPIFFSETGCNVPGPRLFDDQDAIFTEPMVADWSGAIVYEWLEEQNNYGLISYGAPAATGASGGDVYDGYTRQGTPSPVSPDFSNLKTKWATNTPTGVSRSDYNTSAISTRACPTSTSGGWWEVNGNVKLPTLGETYTPSATYTTVPTATADSTDASGPATTSSSDKDGAASGDKQIAAMSAALVGVMLIFTVWL